jgi:hypothetical protein
MSKGIKEKGTVDVQSLIRKVLLLSNCYRQLIVDKKDDFVHRAKEDFVTFFSFKYFNVQDHERFLTAVRKKVSLNLHYPTNTDVFDNSLTCFEISIEGFEKFRYIIPVTECGKFSFKELDNAIIDREGMRERDDEVEKLSIVIDAINIKIQDFSEQKFCYGIFKNFKSVDTPDTRSKFPQYETFIELLDATFSQIK